MSGESHDRLQMETPKSGMIYLNHLHPLSYGHRSPKYEDFHLMVGKNWKTYIPPERRCGNKTGESDEGTFWVNQMNSYILNVCITGPKDKEKTDC